MKMPRLELSDLPDLDFDLGTGLYGSTGSAPQDLSMTGDLIVVLMVFIYDWNGGGG